MTAPAALTTAPPVPYSDGWLKHDIPGTPFFINANPKGTAFHVLEAGTDPRGTALTRGKCPSLGAALKLTAALQPSTTADILDRAAAGLTSGTGLDYVARLRRTGEPGTRLWILPPYTGKGYRGLGEAATALGLAVIGIEALFGSPPYCWTVRYRTDSGEESTFGGGSLLTLAEARSLWWVTDGLLGHLLTGGHPDRLRMQALGDEFPNDYAIVRQGAEFMPEA